jgi:hypothetical protein
MRIHTNPSAPVNNFQTREGIVKIMKSFMKGVKDSIKNVIKIESKQSCRKSDKQSDATKIEKN